MHRLGIARDTPWVWINSHGTIGGSKPDPLLQVDGPEGVPSACPFPYAQSEAWDGYSALLVGVLVYPEYFDYALGPTGLPWQWADAGRTFTIELYYQRVRYRDSPLYTELVTGRPGRSASIQGAHLAHGKRDRSQAWDGMDLLLTFEAARRGGRRTGWRKGRVWTERDILDWYQEAAPGYASDGSRPELTDLAVAMGLSTDTTRNRLRDVGLSWPPKDGTEDEDPDE